MYTHPIKRKESGENMYTEDDFRADTVLLIFGRNIKKAREKQNLTKQALALQVGYDRASLSKLEKGEKNIRLTTAVKLARALDVDFPFLFSRHFMENNPDADAERFQEDDYLLVFRENFIRKQQQYTMAQINVTDITGINKEMVNRIVTGARRNPTLRTLYALAYSVNEEMYTMFARA